MTQADRDRLVTLKKAKKKLITQAEAAAELQVSVRHVKRMLKELGKRGDSAVVHGLRGQESNRKIDEKIRQKAVKILSAEVYRGFGPTLASEHLANKHSIEVSRETVRKWMQMAGLWKGRRRRAENVHMWRQRWSRCGELEQWDTSEHDWLEGRGEKLYLIHMIDDATSELTARFVAHDSSEENLRLLRSYLEQHGRPLAFYTDKASLFQTAPKVARDSQDLPRDEREPLPPTQIGRALRELGIVWMPAHSPQAKGRVERSFGTAQDRLVKGLRVAGARNLEQANRYLQEEFLPWWNQHLVVQPANPVDAHRPLGPEHNLASALSRVETRQVSNDYSIALGGYRYRVAASPMPRRLRGATVRVEARLDATLWVRFGEQYFPLEECAVAVKVAAAPPPRRPRSRAPQRPCDAARADMDRFFQRPAPPVWGAAKIDRTRTRDRLD